MTDRQAPDAAEGSVDRRTVLQMMAALGGLAGSSAAAEVSGGNVPAPGQGALWSEIDAVLRRTEEIWNSQEFSRLKDVWDSDDPEPWYVAEEVETAFRTWPEIEKYWGPGRRVLRAFRWQFSNLQVKALTTDLALRQKIVKPDFKAFSDQVDAQYRERQATGAGGSRP